jgi:hypothetical protein
MNHSKNAKDTRKTNDWFKQQGLNPIKCINPDFDSNFIRAKVATHKLLTLGTEFLTPEEINLLNQFRIKPKATRKQIFQILNLNKRIKRHFHKKV